MLLRFVVKHHIFFKAAPQDDSILAQKILPTVNQASDKVTNSEHKRSIYFMCNLQTWMLHRLTMEPEDSS